MKKREYQRQLCELLVGLLINGPTTSETDELDSVLILRHPYREAAFVDWALGRINAMPGPSIAPAPVGEYL
jgi:hypothetical protein